MFDMLGSKAVEGTVKQIIAALLTIAFVLNKDCRYDEEDVWKTYQEFLKKEELNMVTKEDYNKMIASLKESGLWK